MIFSPSCQVLKLHPEWAPRGVRRFVSMLRPLGGSQWATNGQINSSNMSLQIISNNNMIITCNFKQLLYVTYILYILCNHFKPKRKNIESALIRRDHFASGWVTLRDLDSIMLPVTVFSLDCQQSQRNLMAEPHFLDSL